MIEVKGKYNSAKVLIEDYSKLEEACYKQILNLLNQKFSEGSNIVIMPDTHAGAGCVIGFTQTITDKVVPNLVELIKANEGLVWDSALKYYNIHKSRLKTVAEASDFAQEGYIGLIEGVKRFDTTKDVEFSTYVRFWIEQKCRFFARECYSSVKISTTKYEQLMRKKMYESFGVDCIKSPNLDEVDRMTRVSSLNIIIGDSYDEMIDLLADNNTEDPLNECAQASEHDYLQHLFDKYLTEREQHVIKLLTKCLLFRNSLVTLLLMLLVHQTLV